MCIGCFYCPHTINKVWEKDKNIINLHLIIYVKELYELDHLLSELEDHGKYFKDFISTDGIEAGIILLHPNEDDIQDPHSVDEVYYVIKGMGILK